MKKNFKKHIGYYLGFTLVQLAGLAIILMASGNKQVQLFAMFATTVFYFAFAILHHVIDHDLTSKIVVEYALIGCLGLAVAMILF